MTERLLDERNALNNSFGIGRVYDGQVRTRIAEIDRALADVLIWRKTPRSRTPSISATGRNGDLHRVARETTAQGFFRFAAYLDGRRQVGFVSIDEAKAWAAEHAARQPLPDEPETK